MVKKTRKNLAQLKLFVEQKFDFIGEKDALWFDNGSNNNKFIKSKFINSLLIEESKIGSGSHENHWSIGLLIGFRWLIIFKNKVV